MASIFTKIINGDIPSFKLFEDEWTFCFLDIRPVQPGHALIIPKTEVDHFTEVPEPYYEKVFANAKFISKAIQQATQCQRVGLAVIGYEVPHFHLHMIPSNSMAELSFENAKQMSPEDLKQWQEKILPLIRN